MNNPSFQIFCDGGSRGNPGPAACAFLVYQENNLVHSQGRYLGFCTNNQAEYSAVLDSLDWLVSLDPLPQVINYFLDSELVVRQLTGVYKIKDSGLAVKHRLVTSHIKQLPLTTFSFSHIPRHQNSQADTLVNQTLDLHHS